MWDLRQRKLAYVVLAHANLVSQVRFAPTGGSFLATSSYDGTVKVWSTRDWSLIKSLAGHEGKVMDMDVAMDEKHLLTCGYDRTWKTWAHEMEF